MLENFNLNDLSAFCLILAALAYLKASWVTTNALRRGIGLSLAISNLIGALAFIVRNEPLGWGMLFFSLALGSFYVWLTKPKFPRK
jgi:membrane associated rhomboid family serine protease